GVRRAPGLADLRRRNVPFVPPRDGRWAALMAVTMAERPKLSVMSPAVLSDAELRAIRAPALLLIGDGERLYAPQAMLTLAQARMPGLGGAIVPGADHIAAMAQPDDVNKRIIRFLQ
ncbi:MAG: alpha/beta fold hydrolase, partial [Solimonas sp.]